MLLVVIGVKLFIPVLIGAIVGVLGFLPLFVCLKMSKNVTKTSNFGYGATLLLGVLTSLIILFVSVLICFFAFKDVVLPFVLAAAITLCVVAIGYGIYTAVRRDKAAEERKN